MDLSEDFKVWTPLRDEETVEPGELFEESWFFGNLLDRKTRMMSRCFSDPCPSSKHRQEMLVGKSYEETYSSIKNLHESGEFTRPSLIKAPSMPASMPREVSSQKAKESDRRGSKPSLPAASRNNLQRAPSLPLSVDRDEDDEDEESDYSMGRLIRQASLGHSEMLPPRRTSKSMIPATVPRHRPRRKSELESIKIEGSEERRRQHVLNRTKTGKILADLEYEEVKGFKELGFKFDKKELNPTVVNILPGLQEKKKIIADEHKVRRPYLSESWQAQRSTPPVLNNVGKKSAEDMKAQIKFWARAVASNVRQEC